MSRLQPPRPAQPATGSSRPASCRPRPPLLEPAYVAMIRAGEASGRLEGVLNAIVSDRGRREALAERFNSAIRYPIFLVGAAVLILFFFLFVVVPQFEPEFKDL